MYVKISSAVGWWSRAITTLSTTNLDFISVLKYFKTFIYIPICIKNQICHWNYPPLEDNADYQISLRKKKHAQSNVSNNTKPTIWKYNNTTAHAR